MGDNIIYLKKTPLKNKAGRNKCHRRYTDSERVTASHERI